MMQVHTHPVVTTTSNNRERPSRPPIAISTALIRSFTAAALHVHDDRLFLSVVVVVVVVVVVLLESIVAETVVVYSIMVVFTVVSQ
jgi:hypothetical protein